MRMIKLFILTAGFFYAPAALSALDLDGCVQMALTNSRAIKAAGSLTQASAQAYKSARASLRPVLSASGEAAYNRYQAAAGLPDGLMGQAGMQFSVDLRRTLAGAELERLDLEKSRLAGQLAEKDVIRSVTLDYYSLYTLLRKKADYAEALKYFNSHIEDIEKLESSGLDLKLDRARAEMQLKSLEVSAAALDTEIANALASLSSAAGARLKTEDLVFDGAPADGGLPAIQDGAAAPPARPGQSLAARLAGLETASAYEAWRRAGFIYAPALQLGLARNIHPIDPATENYRTYLAVSLDIFDWGAKAGAKNAALETYRAQVETETENKRLLTLSLERLAAELNSEAAAYEALRENFLSAAGNLETAKTYYRQGKLKETDLLSIFSEYLDAKQQSRDALGRYLDKKTELAYLRAGEEK